MSEVWRPGVEPWEALQEADRRYDNTPEPMLSRTFWEGIAARLSGMGWVLVPRTAEDRVDRVCELEAENKRLRGALEKIAGVGDRAQLSPSSSRTVDGIAAVAREALEVSEAKPHEFSIPGVTEEWRRFWVKMDNGQLLFAESAPGDEQPSQEYVEAFERARDYREYVSAYGDLTLRVWPDGTVEVFNDEAVVDRWEDVTAPSPVLEEPEGAKALRFLRELRQYLDRRLRKYGDGDLSDYEVGCKQELEGVSTWLAEFEAQPAPVPVEEA